MSFIISIPVVGIVLSFSILLSIVFVVYALNMLHLASRAQNYRPPATAVTSPKPNVAVHLPIYNELYVVRRLIEASSVMAKTYGKDLVRICVIDDSDDETREEIDQCVSHLSSSGYNIDVLRRGARVGFKAGALQAALEQTTEMFIAIFDADFSPPSDFLDKTVPLMEDKSVGFVQCRWGHIDGKYNLITEALAIGVDAHFLLEQTGRYSSGYMINFSGSAGLLRRDAIIKSGGWNIDTLAEDMDLSYRMQLAGYKPIYLRDFKVPAELPPTITSAKLQQGRWAHGSIQSAKKLIPAILRAPSMSKSQKLEAVIHLTYYLTNPLMVALYLLAVIAALLNINVVNYMFDAAKSNWLDVGLVEGRAPSNLTFLVFQVVPRAVFSGVIILLPIAVLFYFGKAVRVERSGFLQNTKKVLMLLLLGYGMSINNSVGAIKGVLSSKTGAFLRTPKYGVTTKNGTWKEKKYQLNLDKVSLLEGGAVGLGALALFYAASTENIGIIPVLAIYLVSYALVFALTLRQSTV